MNPFIAINQRRIGIDYPPYVIAELSANHNGNIDNALKIIDIAYQSGASAVKLQTYRPDTITIKSDRPEFTINGGLWDGKTLYDLYEWAHTPWDWHPVLFDHAKKCGITIFSSPFDTTAVDLLEDLNAPAYKIASFEAIDLPLIRYVAATGKPIIISTGMANQEEIHEAIDAAREAGAKQLCILHCVSGYPAPAADYNLKTLTDMQTRFSVPTGLSDHTLDNATAIAAVALGACVIEKHATLDRNAGGPDDSFSLEPAELKRLCQDTHTAWQALGRANYEQQNSEKANTQFRRSLYFVNTLKKGKVIRKEDVKSIRPGFGLAPKYLPQVLGKTVQKDVDSATPVSWDLLADH